MSLADEARKKTTEHAGSREADETSEHRTRVAQMQRAIEVVVKEAAGRGESSVRLNVGVFERWAPPYDEVARWALGEGFRVSHDSWHCGCGVYEWYMVLKW